MTKMDVDVGPHDDGDCSQEQQQEEQKRQHQLHRRHRAQRQQQRRRRRQQEGAGLESVRGWRLGGNSGGALLLQPVALLLLSTVFSSFLPTDVSAKSSVCHQDEDCFNGGTCNIIKNKSGHGSVGDGESSMDEEGSQQQDLSPYSSHVMKSVEDALRSELDDSTASTMPSSSNSSEARRPHGICSCLESWNGSKCETYCPLSCRNGGICQVVDVDEKVGAQHTKNGGDSGRNGGGASDGTSWRCRCPRGSWAGELCDLPVSDTCPDGSVCIHGAVCKETVDDDDDEDREDSSIGDAGGEGSSSDSDSEDSASPSYQCLCQDSNKMGECLSYYSALQKHWWEQPNKDGTGKNAHSAGAAGAGSGSTAEDDDRRMMILMIVGYATLLVVFGSIGLAILIQRRRRYTTPLQKLNHMSRKIPLGGKKDAMLRHHQLAGSLDADGSSTMVRNVSANTSAIMSTSSPSSAASKAAAKRGDLEDEEATIEFGSPIKVEELEVKDVMKEAFEAGVGDSSSSSLRSFIMGAYEGEDDDLESSVGSTISESGKNLVLI